MDDTHARILIVEDELRVMQSLKELLELHDYDVDTAAGSQDAIKQLKTHHYDVALLDLQLPRMQSRKVLDYVGAGGWPTAVIALSGEASADRAVDALKRGAYDFLRKPYAPEQLIKAIDDASRKRRCRQDNAAMEARLLKSEKLHRYIVESSPDLIYMLDTNGRFTFVNSRIESLLGFRKPELLGVHYSTLVYESDEDLSRYVFNERRTGARASRNVELRLKRRGDRQQEFGEDYLTVEINSAGMYGGVANGTPAAFKGTYGLARDISDRKKVEAIVSFQASHDLLTRLPNRFLFKDRLALAISQAHRNPQTFAIMFLDLDRFKFVNDTLGHVIGDQLLQSASKRILACLREGDTLARAGGDEYMLLLPQAGHRDDAAEVAKKVLDALRRPFLVDGRELFVTISVGIALYPEHGENPETLIRRADIAMYEAKSRGKNTYEFYSHDMPMAVPGYAFLEDDIREALSANQFTLYYQPQIDVASGKVTGVEALLRWQHPTRDLLEPAEFISAAEDSGLIIAIGEWVLRKACEEISGWRAEGLPPVRLAVNFSARQFEQADFAATVLRVLDEYKLPGEALEIEIIESAIIKDYEETARKLRDLSRRGVRIAVDDFGTGYASLGYLRRLPVDTLKLDYSFVHDIHTTSAGTSITSAIASMAESLALNLIAEGVETEVQMNYLRSIGCDVMQGFMLSPPLPADAAKQFISRRAGRRLVRG